MSVNSSCYCKRTFNECFDLQIKLLLPCNHYIHEECLKNTKKCPLCNIDIIEILTEEQIKKSKNKQNIIDLRLLKNIETQIDYSKIIEYILDFTNKFNVKEVFDMLGLISHQYNDKLELRTFTEKIIKILNINITICDKTYKNPIKYKNNKIVWKNKSDMLKKKIIIGNHSCFTDVIILPYLFNCGILSNMLFSDNINNVFNNITLKKGEKNTEKIKKYLNKNNKLIVFPEGFINNTNSLFKFKTGAFMSCKYICPVTLKFDSDHNNLNLQDRISNILNKKEINVTITIYDFEEAPFDDKKINNIRKNMAKNLNFDLSNVLWDTQWKDNI